MLVRAECAETVLHGTKYNLKKIKTGVGLSGCWREMVSSERQVLGRSREIREMQRAKGQFGAGSPLTGVTENNSFQLQLLQK